MSTKKHTPLEDKLIGQIEKDGPISVETYMNACLGDPEYGYYMHGDPFGRGGDFTTAPEVSQMFGEAIGVWFATAWQMMGKPEKFNLIELGPGRGTLMADLLRAANVLPEFAEAIEVHMVDMSPALRQVQGKTLDGVPVHVRFHQRFEQVPAAPSLIVANEFFDALPIRQIIKGEDGWHERVVDVADGELVLRASDEVLSMAEVPLWARAAKVGEIAELAPARNDMARQIATFIRRNGGAGLIIDYGHALSFAGDTFQAVRKHKFVDVLDHPGESDLTSHVDFEELAQAFKDGGVNVHGPRTQQAFLFAMGIKERLEMLKKKAPARTRIMLNKQVDRLVSEKQMGHLFKVLSITDPSLGVPHPFEPAHTG